MKSRLTIHLLSDAATRQKIKHGIAHMTAFLRIQFASYASLVVDRKLKIKIALEERK